MKTIVIANQKGGSGKSTVTVHLAAAAEHAGDGPVILSDTDPQGTAADWFNQRKKAGIDTPRYSPLTLAEIDDKLAVMAKAGVSYLFIDTAPSIGAVNADLVCAGGCNLDPAQPDAGRPSGIGEGASRDQSLGKAVSLRIGPRQAEPPE